MTEWAGSKWLAEAYGIEPVQRFRIVSQITAARKTTVVDGFVQEAYPPSFRPAPTLRGHLTFAMKHEGIHLEFLARLCHVLKIDELLDWIKSEPTGSYSRRAGFFYEWLTGVRLAVDDVQTGSYVDAINPENNFCASHARVNKRWRVRDNLPGTSQYCPGVHRSDAVRQAEQYNCGEALTKLEAEYGPDILMRSAVWLSIKESRASFAIEHEEKQLDRIKRFATVMENRCGQAAHPFAQETLLELQSEILGKVAIRYGMRSSPVFVGHTSGYSNVVDYIAPHWHDTPALMQGLAETIDRTAGRAPLVRAAIAAFGFVYIHPMADGNGRISRFMVNDILRRDGAVPPPFILPISATITQSPKARAGYDKSLEAFSKPLLQKYSTEYEFGRKQTYEDGVQSDFHFKAYADALFAWRYPDLTSHVEYLASIVKQTIEQDMVQEARFLRTMHMARQQIKEILEGPDADIDRIIRAVRENGWAISNKLGKEFPVLLDSGLAEKVVGIIRDAFCFEGSSQGHN